MEEGKKQIENGNKKMGWLSNTEGPIFIYVPQRGWKNILFINIMKNVVDKEDSNSAEAEFFLGQG